MANLEKIVDQLSDLTVLEAAELSKMLEEKWGVSAAAPAAVAGPAPGAAGAAGLPGRPLPPGAAWRHLAEPDGSAPGRAGRRPDVQC